MKLKKTRKINVETYTVNDWRIEIVTNKFEHVYEAWLYYKDITVKDYIFGVDMDRTSKEDFIKLVEGNIVDYFASYYKEYIKAG